MAHPVRATLQPFALSVMRMIVGFLFVEHGAQKILGVFGGMGGNGSTAQFLSLLWVAGILELAGGTLIFLGLFTVPVAFVLCGEMAYAYFRVHAHGSFWPLVNHGELAVLYCFVFLFLCTSGSGPLSLDAIVRHKQ